MTKNSLGVPSYPDRYLELESANQSDSLQLQPTISINLNIQAARIDTTSSTFARIRPLDAHNLAYTSRQYSIFIGLVIVAAMCVAAWFLSPKGENQTTWRSSLIIAFVSCYLMWFITFMAQLHPLIEPRRVNIKEGFQHE
ncbi:ATP synthase subunit H-domain-containing protein [Xylaria arbuscula]|nr:ATP synthase subunit H-domain-containing protein [Xylaria arbuscula]